jgi:membrane-associated phospholipid phosphatase
MFAALEAGWGIDVVMALQSTGHPLLDFFATVFDFLGGTFGYLLVLPLIFWSIDRKLGRWLLVVIVTALSFLIGGKELFGKPRPFQFAPDIITPVVEAVGFGFPSGHVGLSMAIWGFVALWAARRWGYAMLAIYVLVMAWARMYAGVHFPQDVIGGFIIGLIVASSIYFNQARLATVWASFPTIAEVAIIIIVGSIMAFLLRGDETGLTAVGILIGGSLGLMLEYHIGQFTSAGSLAMRALRFVVGFIVTMMLFVALNATLEALQPAAVFRVIRYALVAFVILGGYPLLLARTGFTQP